MDDLSLDGCWEYCSQAARDEGKVLDSVADYCEDDECYCACLEESKTCVDNLGYTSMARMDWTNFGPPCDRGLPWREGRENWRDLATIYQCRSQDQQLCVDDCDPGSSCDGDAAVEDCCHCGGGERSETVEGVLCREFGLSTNGKNWYLEGLAPEEQEMYDEWAQIDWCNEKQSQSSFDKYLHVNAERDLDPTHRWNLASASVSLLCFVVWLTVSPHDNPNAEGLDLTLGSFYMMQYASNLLVAVVNVLYSCEHEDYLSLLLLVYLGLSVIGTNILCHRYLAEKANIITKIIDEPNDSTAEQLETLRRYLALEVRAMYPVLLGIILHLAGTLSDDVTSKDAGFLVLEYTILYIMANDLFFSVVITFLFLRPISQILDEGGSGMASQSKGYKHLRDTRRMTLLGSSMAVISSTYLYINLLLFFNASNSRGGLFYDNSKLDFLEDPNLNPLVVVGNADSMVNDVGMLLVCGVFKYTLREKFLNRYGYSSTGKSNAEVKPASGDKPLPFDSRAYDPE